MRRDQLVVQGINLRPAFALFADDVLVQTVTKRWFRRRLHEALLLHPAVVVSDVWAIDSPHLSQRLQERDSDLLLNEGMVVVARRNIMPSMEKAFDRLLELKTNAVEEAQRPYVRRLDSVIGDDVLMYDLSRVGAGFQAMCDTLFNEEMLLSFGVSPDGVKEFLRDFQIAKDAGEKVYLATWTYAHTVKSWEVEGAQRLNALSHDDAQKIWGPTRAAYAFGLPSELDLGVAATDNYSGHLAVAKLRRQMNSTADVGVVDPENATNTAFQEAVNDPRVHWLFSEGVIDELSAEDLLAARSVADRLDYLVAREVFLATPSAKNWTPLVAAMRKYLVAGAEEVLRLWKMRGAFGEDLIDASVIIEGDTVLRLVVADNALQMTGVAAKVSTNVELKGPPVQIVATKIDVPTRSSFSDGTGGGVTRGTILGGNGRPIGSSGGSPQARRKLFPIRWREFPLAA